MRLHPRTLWAVVSATALALAACGSDGGDATLPAPSSVAGSPVESSGGDGAPAATGDLCAQFPPDAIQPFVSWTVPDGRSEVLGTTASCSYESAPGDAFGSVKIRRSPASSVAPAQNPYEVDGLGDSATVDRNFAATSVLVGDQAYTVQVVGAAEPAPDIAAAHPDLVKGDGPASTEELQASLALTLSLADRFGG